MCKEIFSFILILILILGLSPTAFAQAQPQKPPEKPPEEPPPVLSVPKDYRYSARGRRDPFVNPVPKPLQPVAAPPRAAPACGAGLKGVLLAQASIVGVVTSKEPTMNVVVVGGPGNKTYFARVGDTLCDAVVKTVKLDTVTFASTAPGGDEQKTPREIVRKVRPTPGEEK